jgi:hypothetical protein
MFHASMALVQELSEEIMSSREGSGGCAMSTRGIIAFGRVSAWKGVYVP